MTQRHYNVSVVYGFWYNQEVVKLSKKGSKNESAMCAVCRHAQFDVTAYINGEVTTGACICSSSPYWGEEVELNQVCDSYKVDPVTLQKIGRRFELSVDDVYELLFGVPMPTHYGVPGC